MFDPIGGKPIRWAAVALSILTITFSIAVVTHLLRRPSRAIIAPDFKTHKRTLGKQRGTERDQSMPLTAPADLSRIEARGGGNDARRN